jgi:hypothetical protein
MSESGISQNCIPGAAQHEMMRSTPGIVTNAAFEKIRET